MDPAVLKKKLSTYVTEGGQLRNVSEDLLCELLRAWEEWTGTGKEFYTALGFSKQQMASLIGKAKRLKREGYFGFEQFKEIRAPEAMTEPELHAGAQCRCIELQNGKGQVIRFPQLSQLMEYLEKAG